MARRVGRLADGMKAGVRAGIVAVVLAAASAAPAAAFSIKVQWPQGTCPSQAPGFTFIQVPRGTASFRMSMVDLDLPSFRHGGGTVSFTGQMVYPPGEAFGRFGYSGPCPPPGRQHRYEWTAEALDASGKVLGTAKARLPYSR